MDARRAVAYLKDHVGKYGAGATLHELEIRLINKVVGFQILKGMTVTMPDVKDPGLLSVPGFEGRFVSVEQLWKYSQDEIYEMPPGFLNTALARGDRCYALFEGDTLAGYGWYSTLPTALDDHFVLHFDPVWTYMYKGYTLPSYRGKRLHALGMCSALQALTREGRKGLISCAASNNFASLRSVDRIGYRIFGDAYLLRVAGRTFTYATRSCREYGFRVEPLVADTLIPRETAATIHPRGG